MKNVSPQVDLYITEADEFAQPILKKLRNLFHKACPEIEETIKWRNPCFEYKGIVAGVAAFKKHVTFHFWKGKLMRDPKGIFCDAGDTCMTGLKLTDVSELPADKILVAYIKEAVALNRDEVKAPHKKKKKKLAAPDYFMAALKKNKKALAAFEDFSAGYQREYVEWVTEAKQEATRQKRLATAVEWMAEGKSRNWKYMKKK